MAYQQTQTATTRRIVGSARRNAGFPAPGNYILNARTRRRAGMGMGRGMGMGELICPTEFYEECYESGGTTTTSVVPVVTPTIGVNPVCDSNVLYPAGSHCALVANVAELQRIALIAAGKANMPGTVKPPAPAPATSTFGASFAQTGAEITAWVSKNSTMVATIGVGLFTLVLATSGGKKGRR